jgi:hypothetical protein
MTRDAAAALHFTHHEHSLSAPLSTLSSLSSRSTLERERVSTRETTSLSRDKVIPLL